MKINKIQLANALHSRWLSILMAVVMLAGAWLMFHTHRILYIIGDRGLLFPSANLWIGPGEFGMWADCVLTLVGALLMVTLNNTYNMLRSASHLAITLFLVMSLSIPNILCQFDTGPVMVVVLLTCMLLMFHTYGNRSATGNVYLVFLILSTCSMTQYCYVVYIPVFILSLGQMRILCMRTVIATLLGLATPWWVVFGLGISTPSNFHITGYIPVYSSFSEMEILHVFAIIAFTSLLLIAGWMANFMKMISYNSHMRAYMGTLSVMGLVTLFAVCIDYESVSVYAPVLFMVTSFQLCHTFSNHQRANKSSIPLIILISIYLLLYLWRLSY